MTKSVAIHFASAAVSVMASFAVGVNPESSSESAQNAFVSVRADGVRIENGRDFSVTGSAVRVLANPGWRLLTPSDVNLDGASPAVYRVVDYSRENDADGNIDLVETETDDVHVEPPEITAQASCGGLYVIGYPETNIEVSVTFTASLKKAGSHRVTARTYKNGELTSTDGPNDVGTAPDVWKWQWHAGPYSGSSNSRTFTTNLVFKPGRYDVSGRVTASLGTCCECSAEADAETDLLVSLLTVECNPWIGQDRTGDPDDPYESPKVTASARLEPDVPGVSGVEWEYGGDMTCDEFHPDAWTATLWSTQRDAHSKSHLGDMLTATVLGASATTNFTVVKVDVIVDGAGESAEESEGGLTPFVADDNGRMTETGTNALALVSFACEPKNLPTNEVVSVRCCGAGELYEITPKGEYKHIETAEYPACDISFRRFGLHGHKVSPKMRDGSIVGEHISNTAKDEARYTGFTMKFATPAGDPVFHPVSGGAGQNEFTFTDGGGNGMSGMTIRMLVMIEPFFADDQSDMDVDSNLTDAVGVFSLPLIAGTNLEYVNAPDGIVSMDKALLGPPYYAYFAAMAYYNGYPLRNSDFGRKTVKFSFKGVTIEQDFEVFFEKYGKRHPQCSTCAECPNWFYYWREGEVCSIPRRSFFIFSPTRYGFVVPELDSYVRLCEKAAERNTGLETYMTQEGSRIEVTGEGEGIKCVAEVVAHECGHLQVYRDNRESLDSDGDGVSDQNEDDYLGVSTLVGNPDTYCIGAEYATYGDDEIRCRLRERNTLPYHMLLDWCNPGCQSKNRFGPEE